MNLHDISSLAGLRHFSRVVYKEGSNVFLLSGDLGAGKTTFVSAFIKENLISKDESFDSLGVMSPTFSLINQYQTRESLIVHADMYRLKENDFEEEELLQLIEEADYSFIEWPSKIKSLASLGSVFNCLELNFKLNFEKRERLVSFKKP